ncbi:hypothetical protein D9M73_168320 [compost metagenome]
MADPGESASFLGNTSCSSIKASSRSTLLHDSVTWIEGFMSAQHPELSDWDSFVNESLDRKQREEFIFSFCNKYTKAILRDVAISLLDFLEHEKGYRAKRL